MNWKKTLLICVSILIAGGAVTAIIFLTEPTAERSGAVKETAMLVEVTEVERGTYRPVFTAMGTVEPSLDVTLSPRVAGEVIALAPGFTPGGYVTAGETLLRIDPSDYENALRQRRSELSQAAADLSVEMGRQEVAQQDYVLLDEDVSEGRKALVLREPQLTAARAKVEAARAAVAQAELDLERTTIVAPFDAHILRRHVNVGSQVTPGDDLGRLVGLDACWVVVTVPLSKLRWLSIPERDEANGSKVTIRNRSAWPPEAYREGHLYKLVGALEDQTRMARVLVTVPDPLARESAGEDRPVLMLGSFVEAAIEVEALPGIVRLDRDYVRGGDTVWVMEDGRLRIRDVSVLLRDADYAYITDGLEDGDRIVTTNLATVADGARLRVEADATAPDTTSSAAQP